MDYWFWTAGPAPSFCWGVYPTRLTKGLVHKHVGLDDGTSLAKAPAMLMRGRGRN